MADQDAKLGTLQQQGTLNPRPKAVRDELFLQDEFFDTRDLVQVKYEMLRRVRTEGKSVTDAAANFGFSRPSFYQAQAAFEQNGLAGLVLREEDGAINTFAFEHDASRIVAIYIVRNPEKLRHVRF